jgi:hypothetical protein
MKNRTIKKIKDETGIFSLGARTSRPPARRARAFYDLLKRAFN